MGRRPPAPAVPGRSAAPAEDPGTDAPEGTDGADGAAGRAHEHVARRRFLAGATAVPLGLLAASCSRSDSSDTDGTETGTTGLVRLDVVDASGTPLDFEGLRCIQSNDAGEEGWDDQLLDAETLEVVTHTPLEEDGSDDDAGQVPAASARLELPDGAPATLSLSWPTSHGYSALMADIPGPGRYSLAELAARSLHERQVSRLEALPAGEDRTRVETLRTATATALDECTAASDPVDRAVCGAQALECAASAQLALDAGVRVLAPGDAVVGVTFTGPPGPEPLAAATGIGRGSRRTAARLVVENPWDARELDSWRSTVAELHAAGGLAMVQICDSQAMADISPQDWDERVSVLLEAFPDADAWEVGNELGGVWTGRDAVDKTLRAARAVRADPATAGATTVVTLYHQLGQDSAQNSVLTWARANLTPELLALTDVVGLSVYPQWHPLGTGADRLLTALEQAFPGPRIAVTELGYGAEDLDDGRWWFGSRDGAADARRAVADHLTSVALGRERAWGAPFWWYYLEDESPGAPGGPVGPVLAQVAAGIPTTAS